VGFGAIPLAELIGACREETAKFLRREPFRDAYCFELVRRAISDRDQAAWDAVFAQYRGIVLAWVRQHPARATTREDDDYWLNRTFERFWQAVGPERIAAFAGLAAILGYLKLCCHSVLLDEVRAQGALRFEPFPDHEGATGGEDVEAAAIGELSGRDLWGVISAELHDESERLVAHLCLVLGLKPREVYERHRERFADVADVYRVKRNLLDRLQRSPDIRRFLR